MCRFHVSAPLTTFRSDFLLLLVRLNLGFILRETAATLLHTFLLGSPSERVIHAIKLFFWRRCRRAEAFRFRNLLVSPSTRHHLFLAPLPGSKRISARGVSRFQSLYFVIVLLSLFLSSLVCFIYQKHTKISYLHLPYFGLLSFSYLFHHASP